MGTEWLYEAGIGEERAILVAHGAIIAARVEWGDPVRAGLAEARISRMLRDGPSLSLSPSSARTDKF